MADHPSKRDHDGWASSHWQPDTFRDHGMHADAAAASSATSNLGGHADDLFGGDQFGVPPSQMMPMPGFQPSSHVRGSPAHLSGAATPSKEHTRQIGSIGPPNLTTNPQRLQGSGSANSTNNQSLFKPVGVPANHHEPSSFNNGGSNLINLDTTPDTLNFPQQRGRRAPNMSQSPHQQQHMLGGAADNWAHNMRNGSGLPGAGPMLDDITQGMSNMNMNSSQQQHLNMKTMPSNMATVNMMNPNMSAQMMQQGQLPPRSGPSKLSMMTNQQLMMLAQTVCMHSLSIRSFSLARSLAHNHICPFTLTRLFCLSDSLSSPSQDMPLSKGYKTVLCKFWEINMCAKGSTCTFAHGMHVCVSVYVRARARV